MNKKIVCMAVFLISFFVASPTYALQLAELNEKYNAIQTLDMYNKYQLPMLGVSPGFTEIDHSNPDYDFYTSIGRTMLQIATNKNNYTVFIIAFLPPEFNERDVNYTGFVIFKIAGDLYQYDNTDMNKTTTQWVNDIVTSAVDHPGKLVAVKHNNRVLNMEYERLEDGMHMISVTGSVD